MTDVNRKDYLLGAAASLLQAAAWRLGIGGSHTLRQQAEDLATKIAKELGME